MSDVAGSMGRLRTESLRAKASAAIRAGIITGQIEGGRIYSARTLAEQFGVSATPVREALLDLSNEGLVWPVRNRGFQIVEPSEHDLDEILELRLMVEVPAAGRAAKVLTEDDIALLRRWADAMEDAVERGDMAAFVENDMAFHLHVVGRIGNQRLVELIRRLREQARLRGLAQLAATGRLAATAAEHTELIQAFTERDSRRAQNLMREHLRHTRGVWAGQDEDGAS
jgi:DNA-binding GntR family transcriptional regulator